MKRLLGSLFLVMWAATPASASVIWGPVTLSDDNGGLFLAGASVAAAGNIWTLLLPNYSTTSTFDFPPNEVDLSLSATAIGESIIGVRYSYFGSFTGLGSASYLQAANAASASGSFAGLLQTGFLPVSPTGLLNLSTTLNLLDGGDSAAISEVKFELTSVPEPASLTLTALGVSVLLRGRFRARRNRPTS